MPGEREGGTPCDWSSPPEVGETAREEVLCLAGLVDMRARRLRGPREGDLSCPP
jgi:hypothetical protein